MKSIFLFVILGLCIECTPAKTAAGANLAIDATVCILNHAADPPEQIAVACGIQLVSDVNKVISAHRAAMARGQ